MFTKEKDPTRERKTWSCEPIGFAFVYERRGHNFSEFFSILKRVKSSSDFRHNTWTQKEQRKEKSKLAQVTETGRLIEKRRDCIPRGERVLSPIS